MNDIVNARHAILASTSVLRPTAQRMQGAGGGIVCCWLGCVSVLVFACAGCARLEPEVSVNPGINESYTDPAIDVGQAIERFEREGREVYDQREALLGTLALAPGMQVADIGAGTGLFTLPMAEAVGPDGLVYAVDIAESFVGHVEERARLEGLDNIRGIVCSERSVELPPNSIDLAFLCDTYHHFEYPRSTLASLRRALKPGGKVWIVDFKRVEGESSEWVMNHVRAGQETTEAEMAEAGFEKVSDVPLLRENYVVEFQSTRR